MALLGGLFELDATLLTVAAGAVVIGAVSGGLGCFAYLRRQALVGDVISHAALLGIVAALEALADIVAFRVSGLRQGNRGRFRPRARAAQKIDRRRFVRRGRGNGLHKRAVHVHRRKYLPLDKDRLLIYGRKIGDPNKIPFCLRANINQYCIRRALHAFPGRGDVHIPSVTCTTCLSYSGVFRCGSFAH